MPRCILGLLFSSVLVLQGADYFPPPDSQGGWRQLDDAASIRRLAGMDLARLEGAYAATEHTTPNGGLLVVRHGYLVYEKYFGLAHRNANPDMASTGKAFTSIACGIMLQEFASRFPQGLNQKVFTPEFLPEAFPLDDPRKADITLGQLLCMSAGFHGEGTSPGVVKGETVPLQPVPGQDIRNLDQSSLRTPLWCAPGAGYSYSSPSPHIASIVLRHVTGQELQDYIQRKLAQPMGWGQWSYCLYRGDITMTHVNGAGSTALHATDALRFAYCLLHQGRWEQQQLVPAAYIQQCHEASPYNPHGPFSLQFEHNADGHVAGAPHDAFYKSGAGGFCLYVIPSLDLIIYKLGGNDGQYSQALTRLPQPLEKNPRRTTPTPYPKNPFNEGYSLTRIMELVCSAVTEN